MSKKKLIAVGGITLLLLSVFAYSSIFGLIYRNLAMHSLANGVTTGELTTVKQAERYAQQAVQFDHQMEGELAFRLGLAYKQLGLVDEEIAQYEKAISAGRQSPSILIDLLFRLGVYYDEAGEKEVAVEYFQQVLAVDAETPPIQTVAYANVYLGQILGTQTGDLVLAREYLEKALDLLVDGFIMSNYRMVAMKMSAVKEYQDQALEMAITATTREPSSTWTTHTRCRIHLTRHEYEDAVTWCQRSIDITPDNEHSHVWLGVAYSQLGLWEQALTEFELAIEINPNNPWYFKLMSDAQQEISGES